MRVPPIAGPSLRRMDGDDGGQPALRIAAEKDLLVAGELGMAGGLLGVVLDE